MAEQDETPQWVTDHNRQHDARERQTNELLQLQLDDSKFVAQHSPEFWREFVERAHFHARGVASLRGYKFNGTSELMGTGEQSGQQTCYIAVNLEWPNQPSGMRLHYRPADDRITCYYMDQPHGCIELVRHRDAVHAITARGGTPKTADQLAEKLVLWMVDEVKKMVAGSTDEVW